MQSEEEEEEEDHHRLTEPEENGDESLSLTSKFRNIEPCDKLCAAQHAHGLPFEYANN